MQISIDYKKKDDSIVHISYYPSFLRNKDLRDEIGKKFFNNEENIEMLKQHFFKYTLENKISKTVESKVIKDIFEEDNGRFQYLNPLITSITASEYDQFFMNVFYNAIKKYFNRQEIDLALFLNFNELNNMAFAVKHSEMEKWIELLEKYQHIELCPAMNWYLYQSKNPYPLKRLFDDFKNNEISSDLIIRNENFHWTDKESITYELYDELESIDSDDSTMEELKEQINEIENTPEFELMVEKIESENEYFYKSLKDVLELNIFEYELFEKLK